MTIKDDVCKMLKIDPNIKIEETKTGTNPYYDGNKIVLISTGQDWNITYQMTHELLHVAFDKYTNVEKKETMWIEEVVCEAFSIYCLKKYRGNCADRLYWRGYLKEDFYLKNGNTKTIASPTSISHLNSMLTGHKNYDVLQFIHPYVLKIIDIIDEKPECLIELENISQFCKDGVIVNSHNNDIAKILLKIQEDIGAYNEN